MNKLEEYRDSLLIECMPFDHEGHYGNNMIIKGFDAAIALDLPVKFADWWDDLTDWSDILAHFGHSSPNTKQLYEYWLEKIYKP